MVSRKNILNSAVPMYIFRRLYRFCVRIQVHLALPSNWSGFFQPRFRHILFYNYPQVKSRSFRYAGAIRAGFIVSGPVKLKTKSTRPGPAMCVSSGLFPVVLTDVQKENDG